MNFFITLSSMDCDLFWVSAGVDTSFLPIFLIIINFFFFFTLSSTDYDSVLHASAGVDTIFHLAALIEYRPRDRPLMHRVNVLGTRHVVNAVKVRILNRSKNTILPEFVLQKQNQLTLRRSTCSAFNVFGTRHVVRGQSANRVQFFFPQKSSKCCIL